jgi:hypothetical protein
MVKMTKSKQWLSNLSKLIGLVFIPYVYTKKEIGEKSSLSTPETLQAVRAKIFSLTEKKKLDDALSYSKDLYEKENDRGDKIENKAHNLFGIAGIASAFITGLTGLLPQVEKFTFLYCLIIAIYLLTAFSIVTTVLLAVKVVAVGKYKFVTPSIEDVFALTTESLENVKQERLATYIYSYSKNSQIHNVKATYLFGSQIWFRNTILLFLLVAILLVFNLPSSSPLSPSQSIGSQTILPGSVQVTETKIPFPTQIKPAHTIRPVNTPATESATNTPYPVKVTTP